MSWPADQKPRYTVTTLTGTTGCKPSYLILDRAHNHHRVHEYRASGPGDAHKLAHAHAHRLNQEAD